MSAQTEPDRWMRLVVFDDGWVELPGFARGLSDTRAQLRTMLRLLGLVVLAGLATWAASALDLPSGVVLVPAMVFLLALVWASVVGRRQQAVNLRQSTDDYRQARADRAAERTLRRAPGAPLLRRARTAQQLADWLQGAVHVDGSSVLGVRATTEGDLHVVHVRLSSGVTRRYASPDGALPGLLAPFALVR